MYLCQGLVHQVLVVLGVGEGVQYSDSTVVSQALKDSGGVVVPRVELVLAEGLETVPDRRDVLEPADPRLDVARIRELASEEHERHHDYRC